MYLKISEIRNDKYINKNVMIRGWVYRKRDQKEKTFLLIRDENGDIIQTVFPTVKTIGITIESSVGISGILKMDKRAPESGFEIHGIDLTLYNVSKEFPIGEYQSLDLLLNKRHLSIRTRRMIHILKIRSAVLKNSRYFFEQNNWLEVNCPMIVQGAVEGGSTLFKMKYFDENEVYLSQSSQLYLEALIFSLGPVWTISPSFRAERSRTIRHLAEFLHLEAEFPWISLDDLMKIQEDLVRYVVNSIITNYTKELNFLKRNISDLENINKPFNKITYEDAIEILRKKDFEIFDDDNGKKRLIEYGDDLNIESERELTKDSCQPLFVIGYPLKIKPFYVKENPNKHGEGLAVDLLAPNGYGELSSGGMREDDVNLLLERIKNAGFSKEQYDWYIDLRMYGSVPHGGFGLGIERFMRWLLDINDIKETTAFPRTMSRVRP